MRQLIFVAGALVVMLALLAFIAPAPGIEPGKIRPCPASPNCVSSLDTNPEAHIPPLAEAARQFSWSGIRAAVTEAGGTIVFEQQGYLWATFTSRLFRFVDDVEILRDANGVLQIRSASRAGWSDLGVNRQRVTALRALLGAGAAANRTR